LIAKPYETQTPEQIRKLLEGGIGKDLVLYFSEERITKRYNPFLGTLKKLEHTAKKLVGKKVDEEGEWKTSISYDSVVGTLKNYGKEPKTTQKDPDKYFIEFEIMAFLNDESNPKEIMECVKKETLPNSHRVVRNAHFYGLDFKKIVVEFVE
jgi:hypothetical protein